jgi:flagellar biosynthesis protein FlhA
MNAALLRVSSFLRQGDYRSAAGPVLIILILAMMVLPLPPFILDLLFTFNIALSIIVLLISMHTLRPLDFSSFPSILLITTLMRLSLNVASTRVVLMEGHTGPDAAGKVIEAFGHFLVGGNYTVGIVLFVILVIINFMVISKGAGRIAEVSARFTLDAMPGKQMAIDADLNAGLIREDEARKRRTTIAQEAEFFGSMDGASKFVRGDSVAGIAILLINIIGGLAVGVLQHNMDIGHAATNYTLLTIGDGLVAQIPALVISTAAGIMVSRVSTDKDVGQQLSSELFAMPMVLMTTAGVIGLLGLVPGMPHIPFILFGGGLGYLGWYLKKKREIPEVEPVLQAIAPVDTPEASWDDVSWVDVLGLEIGYRLIPLVDKSQDGELLRRIKGIRKKFTQDMGFLAPVVHIRDNLELGPSSYRITLKGVEIGHGEVQQGKFLAINPGGQDGHGERLGTQLPGTPTVDPTFGLPAMWITADVRDRAQAEGYTVVDCSTVIATHVNQLIYTHSTELLGRLEVQQLLDHLARTCWTKACTSATSAPSSRRWRSTEARRKTPPNSPPPCGSRWVGQSPSTCFRPRTKCRSSRSTRIWRTSCCKASLARMAETPVRSNRNWLTRSCKRLRIRRANTNRWARRASCSYRPRCVPCWPACSSVPHPACACCHTLKFQITERLRLSPCLEAAHENASIHRTDVARRVA